MIVAVVVILECKKIIIVPPNWVEDLNSKGETKIFFSPNLLDIPDFSQEIKMFFDYTESKLFIGYVLKKCGKFFFLLQFITFAYIVSL